MIRTQATNNHRSLREVEPFVSLALNPTTESLSEREKEKMCVCEAVLSKGLSTFFDVGHALLTIREDRLYRTTSPTFEHYCRERWGLGRSYAWRVIGAAERLQLLPSVEGEPKPLNEFQVRPFLKLPPEEFPKAWHETVSRAKNGKVTPRLISSVVGELCGPGSKTNRRKRKTRKPALGRVLTMLQEAKKLAKSGDTSQLLDLLDSIESVLFESGKL